MHDEAAVHYIDMIDQTTLGHRFIKEEFEGVPRIGWQIDPFGHSAVQAYLLSAEVPFLFSFSFIYSFFIYQTLNLIPQQNIKIFTFYCCSHTVKLGLSFY